MDGYKNVLIVEDDADYRNKVSDFLSAHGCTVASAETGEEVMEKLLFYKPNLVILDLMLPKLDGFGVLTRIREYPDKEVAETPVIILSNMPGEKEITRAKELGVKDYCVKSQTTFEELLNKIMFVLFKGTPPPSTQIMDFTIPGEGPTVDIQGPTIDIIEGQ